MQSSRRVEESVIKNRKVLLHIVKKFEEIQRNSRKTQSNVKVKDLTPNTSICLQTAVLEDVSLINHLTNQFGQQSIMVSVDVKKDLLGRYKLYSAATGKTLSRDWAEYMKQAVQHGAGEVLLNAVDRDGMMKGMDLIMIKKAATSIAVPLIAVGGVGSLADIKAAVGAGASAVAAGAFFVFHGPHHAVLITYPSYNDLEDLLMPVH